MILRRPTPLLEPGDRLTRDEFERRFDAMPGLKKAELIDGVVYIPSRVRAKSHGGPHSHLLCWIGNYKALTPGLFAGASPSVRLDMENEPQPDGVLMIRVPGKGQARIDQDDYIKGAPELTAEVSASPVSYDLHAKLAVYRRSGVKEYIVWRVLDEVIDWFRLQDGDYVNMTPDADGILRSQVFPGLWLDPVAMIQGNLARVLDGLHQGIASPEHAAFVAALQQP